MHPKVKLWLDTKGRMLVELKLKGDVDFFKTGEKDFSKLSAQEWATFFILTGQMHGVIWSFAPDDEIEEYMKEIRNYVAEMEEEIEEIKNLTGSYTAPRGKA